VYQLLLFALLFLTINGLAFAQQAFVHPGCLSTDADFLRMKTKVEAGAHPWIDTWNIIASGLNETYQDHAQTEVYRTASGGNYQFLAWDANAVYALSLRWKITGQTKYADAGVRVLMAWANKCTRIYGDPNAAQIALNGYQFACAAENLSTYSGWVPADLAKFKTWMHDGPDGSTGNNWWVGGPKNLLDTHFGANPVHMWANWDLCSMAQLMAIAVLCDDRDLYNYVINYWRTGAGNGALNQVVYHMHPGHLGQWQEAGRDQGHAMMGPVLLGVICENRVEPRRRPLRRGQ